MRRLCVEDVVPEASGHSKCDALLAKLKVKHNRGRKIELEIIDNEDDKIVELVLAAHSSPLQVQMYVV